MPNSSAAYFADRMLRGLGLSEASVPAVPFKAKIQAPLSLMSRALASGEVDAVAVWGPYAQACKLAAGGDAIEFCDSALYRECFRLC
jgi:ABC-type nitrate/sulfonate/bicarbonate transport system substrate-binding protein